VPEIPEMPFSLAKGESLATGVADLTDSIIINRRQHHRLSVNRDLIDSHDVNLNPCPSLQQVVFSFLSFFLVSHISFIWFTVLAPQPPWSPTVVCAELRLPTDAHQGYKNGIP
jgi:hypothetical protein